MASNYLPAHPFLAALSAGYRELTAPGASILIAVSGGADSVALLLGSAEVAGALKLHLEVASLDHGLRAEARSEVEQVGELAARGGFHFVQQSLGLPAGSGVEERARQERYRALEALRKARKLDWIATGHTLNDQAETVLMRLARGVALKGVAGILPRQARVIRPMLGATRTEVLDFLASRREGFITDPMNADEQYFRSRVRSRVLPALQHGPGEQTVRRIGQFARWAREDDEMLEGWATDAARRLEIGPGALDRAGLRALARPLRRRVLAQLSASMGAGVDSLAMDRALDAVARGTRSSLNRGFELRASGGRVRIVAEGAESLETLRVELGSSVVDPSSGLMFEVRASSQPVESALRLEKGVPMPLEIRSRRDGDRLGSTHGGRGTKLQDLLVDRKVPREARHRVRVVTDAEGTVLWVVGLWKRVCSNPGELCLFAVPSAEPSGGKDASL